MGTGHADLRSPACCTPASARHCHLCGKRVAAQSAAEIVAQLVGCRPERRSCCWPLMARNRKAPSQRCSARRAKSATAGPRQMAGSSRKMNRRRCRRSSLEASTSSPIASPHRERHRHAPLASTRSKQRCGWADRSSCPESGRSEEARRVHGVGKAACTDCGVAFPELGPPSFSFNSPFGMCPDCTGLGTRLEMDAGSGHPRSKRHSRRGDRAVGHNDGSRRRLGLQDHQGLADQYGVDLDTPWGKLPPLAN